MRAAKGRVGDCQHRWFGQPLLLPPRLPRPPAPPHPPPAPPRGSWWMVGWQTGQQGGQAGSRGAVPYRPLRRLPHQLCPPVSARRGCHTLVRAFSGLFSPACAPPPPAALRHHTPPPPPRTLPPLACRGRRPPTSRAPAPQARAPSRARPRGRDAAQRLQPVPLGPVRGGGGGGGASRHCA